MDPSLKQTIADELGEAPDALTSETVLDDLQNWDSVTALTIMVVLSEAVGSPVTPDEIVALKTFGDIETLVAAKKGG
jgi:acyl carrier protein